MPATYTLPYMPSDTVPSGRIRCSPCTRWMPAEAASEIVRFFTTSGRNPILMSRCLSCSVASWVDRSTMRIVPPSVGPRLMVPSGSTG